MTMMGHLSTFLEWACEATGVIAWGDVPSFLRLMVIGTLPAIFMVLAIITPVGIVGIWGERRLSGRIQSRIGPNRVGIPFLHDKHKWARIWGLGQGLADGVKLLGKEDFVPPGGNPFLFIAAPVVCFAGALGLFVVLPLSDGMTATNMNLGVFYALAVGAIEVPGVLMAGWASDNKWSLLGAMREVAQVVSYEIPMAIVALCPVLVCGTLSFPGIIDYQASAPISVWGLAEFTLPAELGWNIWRAFPLNIIAGVIFYICCLANLKRAPFDLPEAESELVAGFLTEYSGMRWSLFFLGEYAAMFALSGFTATLYLGGWSGPVHALISGGELGTIESLIGGILEFSYKTVFLFILMLQVRWTLPRLRLDQVMTVCFKYFVPISMICLLGSGLYAVIGG